VLRPIAPSPDSSESRFSTAWWVFIALAVTLLPLMVLSSFDFGVTWDEKPRHHYGEMVWEFLRGLRARNTTYVEDGGHLYEGPADLSATATNVFKPVAAVDLWVTDGAFSPDGRQLAVRGYFGGIAYAWNDGRIKRQERLNVPLQGQGESITYTPDGSKLMYGSEGADSPVEPEDVPGASGSGTDSPSKGGGSAAGGGDGGGMSGPAKVGAFAVAALFAVVLGLRRLRRRR